jgi:hypothetical protein
MYRHVLWRSNLNKPLRELAAGPGPMQLTKKNLTFFSAAHVPQKFSPPTVFILGIPSGLLR